MAYFGPSKRVPIGELVVTESALATVSEADALSALTRQGRGDWGEVSRDEWEANDANLRCRGRIRSVYRTSSGVPFLVITDLGRHATMVGLPEDWE
jgi:hypothetical protein